MFIGCGELNNMSGKSHAIYGWDESEPQNKKI